MSASTEPQTAKAPRRRRLRILFFVHNLGKIRHFERTITRLTERGHTVVLAAAEKQKGLRPGKALHRNKRVRVVGCPVRRVDAWRQLAPQLRLARDYLRFFDPAYARATKLAGRAASYAPAAWRDALERRTWLRRRTPWLSWLLRLAEDAIPADPFLEGYIKYHEPDLVLVTPYVNFGSYQTDYVKAARALRIPVAFLPFSWDNLTNRGLIKIVPDRVIVWNETQKRESVELHGVPAERVVVTGASRFDDFFEMQPSLTREAFFAHCGLAPASALLLYTCSSQFIAPREVEFVRLWIEEIRRSAYEPLATAAILVRPHPVHEEQWQATDLSDLPGVALWRHSSTLNADQGLYDSLTYAAAVVGLNTSAMLEAAIVGAPTCTVLAPGFAGGQEETLHFHYLRWESGGILTVARNFDEHKRDLERALAKPRPRRTRAAEFVDAFIRPLGLKRRVDRIVAAEIEAAAELRSRGSGLAPLWRVPVRVLLRLAARTPVESI